MKKKLQFLFSMVALMLVATFAKAQEDVTSQYVKNADLSTDVTATDNGWTCKWRQDYQKAKDDTHVNVVEFYAGWSGLEHTEFSVSQEITLPAGDYRIAVNAFYRQGNDGDGTNNNRAYIFAGEKKQNVVPFSPGMLNGYSGNNDLWKASNAFYQGKFSNAFDFTIDDDNTTISIGFAGTFDVARCWVILGPVKLYKYSLENYLVDYRAKVAEAEPIVNKKMGTTEKAALDAAIVDESSFSKSSEVSAAIATLNTAIINAKKSIADYEELQEALQAGTTIKANSSDATAIETYDAAVADIVAAYEAGTVADFSAAKAVINAALPALAKTQTAPGSDLTPVVTTASWLGAQATPAPFGDGMESYKGGNEGYAPGKVLYQKIEGLIPGIYKVDFYAVANHAREGSAFGDGIAQLYANATTEDITVIDQDWCTLADYPRTLTTKVFSDGVLEYGIQNVAQGGQWYVAKASQLTFVEPISTYAVSIAEGIVNGTVEAAPAKACADEKVSLTITPAEGYQLETLSVKAGEETIEVAEDNTFVMPAAAVTISATFAEIPAPQYAITISDGIENGTVEADVAKAKAGETVTLTITPAANYELESLSVKNGEEDVEVAEGYTFLMPAAAVTVSATFKEKAVEPQPTLAAVKMTYVELDNTTAFGEVTEAKAGYNKIANNEVGFSNTGWNCNWITYIEVDASELKGAVAGAKLKAEISGATDSKRATGWGVGYNASAWSADMTYETADKSITTLGDVVWGTQKSVAVFEPVEFDITEAFKNGAKKATILVYETAAAGGIIKNVKVEMEMQETAPAIANASFEADGEKAASNGPLAITGWTETVDDSYNNSELRPANSASTTSMFGTSNPSDGEFSFFVRHGWNSNTTTITLTSDALGEIPAGDYTLSVDYKQHYAYDDTQNSNTKVSIALVNGETTLGSETSPAAAGVKKSGDATYFNDAEWSTLTAAFTLAEAIPAGAKVVITLDARGQKRSDFFLDNVQFVKVPGVKFALKELEKSLEAAAAVKAKYVVGDGLFQYAASEIEPLTNAIATAQDAYNAAESKDAVNSAKETLDAFVSTFAPVMTTTPAAETAYILSLKTSNEASPFDLSFAAEGGVTIAETGTPTYFVAQEGGKYALYNGTEYVNYEGSNTWTMAASTEAYGWTIVAVEGGYTITGKNGFLGTNISDGNAAGSSCYGDKKTTNGNYIWTIAEYVEPTDPNDYTNMIVNADLTGEGGFDATGTKGIDGSGVVKVGNAAAFDFKQTIANLPAGQYKLTAQAAYRYGGDEAAEAAAIAGGTETKLVQLYATVGEKTVATPIQNRYDGASETDYANGEGSVVVNEKYVPNSTNAVKAWFAAGQYVNEVIFNIAEAGDVTIGINRTGTPESDYTVIGPWTLYRLGDAEVEPEVPSFAGIVEQTVTHPKFGEMGTTTSGQTVKIAEAGEGLVDITFSGFSIETPPTTFEQFTISNVAAETAADGSITYAAGNFQIATKMGQMDVYYNGTLEGVQASAEATPLFKLVLTNAVTDEVYFGADQDAIDAYKASLQPAVYAIAIADEIEGGEVEADVEEAAEGAKVTLTITPDQDYKPGTVTVSYVEGEGEGAETKYVEVAEDYTFTMPAAPVTVSATFTYVEPLDPNLIEIAQSQSPQISDGATRATVVEGDGYTQYTTDGGVCVIVKMYDVDVTGCDYVVIKFAEPIPSGIRAAFWAQTSQDNVELDAGISEYKYVFANDTKCAIQNGILPQITLLTLWNAQTVKISGIYKHLDEEGQVQINDIDAAKAKRNGKFYKKGQFVILNEGKAFSLNGIETE